MTAANAAKSKDNEPIHTRMHREILGSVSFSRTEWLNSMLINLYIVFASVSFVFVPSQFVFVIERCVITLYFFFPRRLLLRCDIIWELSRCSPFRCWYYYYFFSASFALIKQKHTLKITELTENSCESVTLRLCVSAARECIGGRVFSFIAHDYFDYYF